MNSTKKRLAKKRIHSDQAAEADIPNASENENFNSIELGELDSDDEDFSSDDFEDVETEDDIKSSNSYESEEESFSYESDVEDFGNSDNECSESDQSEKDTTEDEDSKKGEEEKVENLVNHKVKHKKKGKSKQDVNKSQLSSNDALVEKGEKEENSDLDTSDEEDIRNTIGNIPLNWYDDCPHIGYDWEGKQIIKPNIGDQLDYFLKRMEDPNFWRTVRDTQTGQDVVLSDKDVNLIKRFESNKIPDESFDEYAPWIEWFTSEVMDMPLRKFPEHKRSFLPSRDEMRKVSKYVHALKMGWMKTRKALQKERKQKKKGPQFYMLWKNDDAAEEMRRIENYIRAPKRPLPDHSESYNPPEEYLFSAKEMKKWEHDRKSLGNRKLHFVPQKYSSLREVPAYSRYIRERFLRCLDLYMCPRAIKMKLTIEPEDLVPHLPSPKDLMPFPTSMSIVYKGHTDMVRSISLDPSGQYLVSGSDDLTVKFWEVCTGRCLKTVKVGGVARSVAWNPNQAISLVAVAVDRRVLLLNPGLGDSLVCAKTDAMIEESPPEGKEMPERVRAVVKWEEAEGDMKSQGVRIILHHFKEVKQVDWHVKGDYFSTLIPEGENRSVLIHRMSMRKSQLPFSKSKGLIQAVLFHPIRPFFFVATQRSIRVYDMIKQEMTKKLYSNSQWISSMALHSGGDNLLVGTYDRKVLWFDLDLSTKPYKSLMLHHAAVRSVAFHKRYPLFASTSDDKSAIVSHGMVYNDLLQNALIVPLKRLSNHETVNDFSVFQALFHPSQPWLFTSGADGTVRLYT